MKSHFRSIFAAVLISLLIGLLPATGLQAQNTSNYTEQGGSRTVIGGSLDIVSGGDLDVESGASLKIAGTAITATAAEVNKSAGVVAGTVTASKAVVVGANKNVDTLAIADGGLKLGSGAGTAVTSTATELNELALCLDIADGSADATYYLVSPHAGTISKIYTVTDGAVSTADITVTANIGATPVTDGAVTIATAASAAGDVDSATPTAANSISAGAAMNFVVAGGGAGGAPRIHLVVVITR